jgi:hypothetical protein
VCVYVCERERERERVVGGWVVGCVGGVDMCLRNLNSGLKFEVGMNQLICICCAALL